MYWLLAAKGELRKRRDQLRDPAYPKPKLLAERPNEVWSWDITNLLGPAKWTYSYLCVILDAFCRNAVGWSPQQPASSPQSLERRQTCRSAYARSSRPASPCWC
jgi:transposase InsO family protein